MPDPQLHGAARRGEPGATAEGVVSFRRVVERMASRGRVLLAHDWSTVQVWETIGRSGVPHHPAYDAGMDRLSCSLCVLGSRSGLVRAAQLRPELAAVYVTIEVKIGHRFRQDLSVAEIVALADESGSSSSRNLVA